MIVIERRRRKENTHKNSIHTKTVFVIATDVLVVTIVVVVVKWDVVEGNSVILVCSSSICYRCSSS